MINLGGLKAAEAKKRLHATMDCKLLMILKKNLIIQHFSSTVVARLKEF
jgi:hypothetical protein